MRCLPARSPSLALIALGVIVATPSLSARAPPGRPPAPRRPDASLEKRIGDLEKVISEHLDAGRIAEAIPPAREKLDLLVQLRGKDHWQAGDARRDVETYVRLATRPHEVRDRFAE